MPVRHALVVAAGALAVVGWLGGDALAHKPITSPFTFYEDVLPITAAQCGACHAPDGIAPMSLLSHESAVPWGESMRLELVAGHMPPWASASPANQFRDSRRLSARELNVLLTWAVGGTPSGDPPAASSATPDAKPAEWPLGAPQETLALPAMDLPADVARTTKEWVLPLTSLAGRRLAGVDLRPGLASVVRSARISTRRTGGSGATAGERLVGLWVPGDQPSLLPAGAAWTIESGTELVVRVSYRKRWDRERDPASDQSTVGLYFAGAAGPDASAVTLRAGDQAGGETRTASATIGEHVRAVALWPEPASAGASVSVEMVVAGRCALARGDACATRRVGAPLLAETPAGSSGGDAPGSHSHVAGRTARPAAGTPLLGLDTVAAR